jgi:DNA polymerase IV
MHLNALYVDFNSYFASVEQQLVPALRGKPVGVLPVMAETTCCIAASYEAKAFGIKTGTKVREARELCPDIIFVEARPPRYVELHHQLIAIVESCSHVEKVLSIDEMVCKLTGSQRERANALALAAKIKQRLYDEAGAYIRCSIGIAPNTFLAKVASNMQKPDGCVVIESAELPQRLFGLQLRQLNGIGPRMEQRLAQFGITSVVDLYAAKRQQLRSAWGSVEGERMYDKLRGIELPLLQHDRSSLGHSHVLAPDLRNHSSAQAVLHRLLQKACMRLRSYELLTAHLSVKVKFLNHPSWVAECALSPTDDTRILTHTLQQLLQDYPARKNTPMAVGVSFGKLLSSEETSLDLFNAAQQGDKLNQTLDRLNLRYGKNTIYFGGAHHALQDAPMRIAFNHVPDLQVESD